MINTWEWPQWIMARWISFSFLALVAMPEVNNRLANVIVQILVVIVLYQGGFWGG